jgi:hypothetical protein
MVSEYVKQQVERYAASWIWKMVLEKHFSKMDLEFEEIAQIEEILEYSYYVGFVKVKSHSKLNEFIEVTVMFDKRGKPSINIDSQIYNEISNDEGRLLLQKIYN